MSNQGNASREVWMPLKEEAVETVDLRGHCIHNSLAVCSAIVEEKVQHCVVAELTQTANARQSDPLNVSFKNRNKRVNIYVGFLYTHTKKIKLSRR